MGRSSARLTDRRSVFTGNGLTHDVAPSGQRIRKLQHCLCPGGCTYSTPYATPERRICGLNSGVNIRRISVWNPAPDFLGGRIYDVDSSL
jgi:hypothetical protein